MIGFHISHEQFLPSRLLTLAVMAEEAGFDAIHSSDHFHPWSAEQGNSGYSFAWLGAAMHATSLPFSVVCAPGQRYHPAIIAQAAATLAEMFPGRFILELGSGEAINERITGEPWPDKPLRNVRLKECAHVIRKLLKGAEVSFSGIVTVRQARLHSLPAEPPALFCAALSKETAEWSNNWADGLLTTAGDEMSTKEKIDAFRAGSRKPVFVQYAFSFAHSLEAASAGAFRQWKNNMVGVEQLADLDSIEAFDAASSGVTEEDVQQAVPLYTDIDAIKRQAAQFLQWGADRVILHNIHPDQEQFLQAYAQ